LIRLVEARGERFVLSGCGSVTGRKWRCAEALCRPNGNGGGADTDQR
jgi:hypothetical protein